MSKLKYIIMAKYILNSIYNICIHLRFKYLNLFFIFLLLLSFKASPKSANSQARGSNNKVANQNKGIELKGHSCEDPNNPEFETFGCIKKLDEKRKSSGELEDEDINSDVDKILAEEGKVDVAIDDLDGDFKKLIANRSKYANQISSVQKFAKPFSEITSQVKELQTLTDQCKDAADDAKKYCLENFSPEINESITTLGTLVDIGGTMGMADQCSMIGKAMNGVNAAMGIFRGICYYNKNKCEKACTDAIDLSKAIKKNSEKVMSEVKVSTDPNVVKIQSIIEAVESNTVYFIDDLTPKNEGSPKFAYKVCKDKELVLQRAGQNIIKLAASAMSGKDCGKKISSPGTVDFCKSYPSLCEESNTLVVDCSKAEYASNTICVCKNNPLDPTCTGSKSLVTDNNNSLENLPTPNFGSPDLSLSSLGELGSGFNSIGNGKTDLGDKINGNGSDGNGNSTGSGRSGGSGGAASSGRSPSNLDNVGNVGSGGRSLGNLGNGGGTSGSGNSAGGGGADSSINPEVMGTDGSYSGGADTGIKIGSGDKKDELKDYLPGGEKDPKKLDELLAQDGVTKGMGMTLFQKVSNRYKEKETTLLQGN